MKKAVAVILSLICLAGHPNLAHAEDQVAEGSASENMVAKDNAAADSAVENKVAADKVAADKVAVDKVAVDKVAVDKAAVDKAAVDKAADEQAVLAKTADEKAVADKIVADKITAKPKVAAKAAKDRVVLMPLRVPAEDETLQGAMEAALVQGLQEKYEVFSGEQVTQKAKEIFLKESRASVKKDCDETRCMQDIAEAFQAELISTANVTKRSDGYFLAVSIQNIFDNKVVFTNSVPCKYCDAYQVLEKLKELSSLADKTQKAEIEFRDCAVCPEMRMIPLGAFDMGGKGKAQSPIHLVTISRSYALGKTEVTQGQWKAIMGGNPSEFKECGDDCPVEKVSWNDAQEYIKKLNAKTGKSYRLPTEAEWEYACRAGGQQNFCGSDTGGDVAWFGPKPIPESGGGWFSSKPKQVANTSVDFMGNGSGSTKPVASKKANAFGLYDMSGNVWEWVADNAHANYTDAPVDGSEWRGGDSGKRILRGGSWYHDSEFIRSDVRGAFNSDSRNGSFGFRVAITR